MKIRLENARAEPFRWQEAIDLSPSALGLDESLLQLGPVGVEGTLSWAAPSYLLRTRLTYRQTVPCDRCLVAVASDVDTTAEWMIVHRQGGGPDGGERELAEEELGLLEVTGDWLETEPLVAEQVQLNLPTHPLCREGCAGLCPRCGANRNEGPCGCAGREGDPRWAALAALRTKDDEPAT